MNHKYILGRCWNEAVRFSLSVTFLWPGGWNLRSCSSLIDRPVNEWKNVLTWRYLKTLLWPLMSGALDLRESLTSPHHTHRTGLYRTVCDLGDAPPLRLLKLWSSMRKEVLDQWSGWHIHWQARYYSSATVPQIVFQVVRNLPSHPQGVYVTGARGSICLPSV